MSVISYNPFDPTVNENPYPHYAQLRADAPIHHNEAMGMWFVARYEDCVEAARDSQEFSVHDAISTLRDPRIPEGVRAIGNPVFSTARHLLGSDPPDHTMMRRLVNRGFTPEVMRRWEPRVRRIAEEQVEQFLSHCEGGSADFVADIAAAVPMRVVAEILGVPVERRVEFKRWTEGIAESVKPLETIDLAALALADAELRTFFAEVVAERSVDPGDDLISMLVANNKSLPDDQALTIDELIEFCAFLLVAGNETTADTMANWMLVMLDHPDLFQQIASDRSLVAPSFEEALRFDTSALLFVRALRTPRSVADVDLPAGSIVGLLYGSANHDERRWGLDADQYVLGRESKDHLSFGSGAHLCLGAPLARMETAAVANAFFDRVRQVEPAGPAVRTSSFVRRGTLQLPLLAQRRGRHM